MDNSSITLKLATTADASPVSQIVALAYKDCQERFKPSPDKIPTWLDWWFGLSKPKFIDHQRFIEEGLTYLIMLNDDIIGTLRLEKQDNECELDDFCILSKYQNQGYGMYSLSLIEDLKISNAIKLATPYFCTASRHLYEKAGYNQVGTRSDNTVICFQKNI